MTEKRFVEHTRTEQRRNEQHRSDMADGIKIVAKNRKAFHDFHIEDRLEAGLALLGTEVKSIREGRLSLQEAYCAVDRHGEMILHGCHVAPYEHAGEHAQHEARRNRKLLMHRREIERWRQAAEQKGYTIVPLKLYFRRGKAKLEIGLGKGKKLYDKRQSIKERETKRRMEQAMREHR